MRIYILLPALIAFVLACGDDDGCSEDVGSGKTATCKNGVLAGDSSSTTCEVNDDGSNYYRVHPSDSRTVQFCNNGGTWSYLTSCTNSSRPTLVLNEKRDDYSCVNETTGIGSWCSKTNGSWTSYRVDPSDSQTAQFCSSGGKWAFMATCSAGENLSITPSGDEYSCN